MWALTELFLLMTDTTLKLYPLDKCWYWWNCWSYVLVVAALGLLAVEIYFEDIEKNLIVKSLILSNDSQTSQILTQKTIVDLQVHLFNITNSEEVVADVVTPPGLKLGDKRYIFFAGLCRSFSFTATEAVFSEDVPQLKLLKMTLDKEQLQSVEENPDNWAFHDKDTFTGNFAPSGFVPLKRCLKGPDVPIFISMPYFNLVDNETKSAVIFESPPESNWEPYFLLDPLISVKKEDAQKLYWLAYEVPVIFRTCLRLTIAFLFSLATLRSLIAVYIKYFGTRVEEKQNCEITSSQNELALTDFAFSTLF
ncbi:unnamed protein product [Rodentolepis nana]|uniref:Transmembrane protein 231 n=1 Tax=Rodentolepis nana TaxID=102285 RepID=A0A0R3TVK9_RODNA|nr:unnamed protein product [Rodentolepis nana]